MNSISIDIETFSDMNLGKCGVYRYADSSEFEILLFAYSADFGPVQVIDLASGEELSQSIIDALLDNEVIKTAFNAQFERICLMKYLSRLLKKQVYLRADCWVCTQVQATMVGLPASLAGVGKILKLHQQKMGEGKALIRYFCTPCNPTTSNGGRTRNLPAHEPEKWELFKKYNIRDVEVELSIREKLADFPIPDNEQQLYALDQKINDLGLLVDMKLVNRSISCDKQFTISAKERAYELTGLNNPNSVVQLKDWLKDRGVEAPSLLKKDVRDLVEKTEGEVEEVLKLRLLMSKTSVKKYESIERAVCSDGRVHGLFKFYGANRTGRWAGRQVQFQNLPQNHLIDLKLARALIKEGCFEDVDLLFGDAPNVLSELIRTAFIPKEGHRFIVADFSAIEARVMSFIAGERWKLEIFQGHSKIYEAAAARMFNVPIEDVTKGSSLRNKGKIAELACQYGGGVAALVSMGALEMGVEKCELQVLIDNWRRTNPNIVKLWWEVDKMAVKAVKERITTCTHGIMFTYKNEMLFVTLPSGRNLVYVNPQLRINKFGRKGLTYEGIGPKKKWERLETYGPKIVENIIQAIARDLLAEAMLNLDKAGYSIVAHVHDEVICEVPFGTSSVNEMCKIMTKAPKWARGLPLKADGYECEFYMKK